MVDAEMFEPSYSEETRDVHMSLEEAKSILTKWGVAMKVRWQKLYKLMQEESIPTDQYRVRVSNSFIEVVLKFGNIEVLVRGAVIDRIAFLLDDHNDVPLAAIERMREAVVAELQRIEEFASKYLEDRKKILPGVMRGFKVDLAEDNLTKGDR